ncbi:MAG: hypothetical protein FWG83_06075 [Oscillospiraceae bacterium]|nr:hypothetical protein [Oscillospiraceae bacterium]
MGMTDRQYEDRQKSLLRDLQDIREEIDTKAISLGVKLSSEKLERAIKDVEDYLNRP